MKSIETADIKRAVTNGQVPHNGMASMLPYCRARLLITVLTAVIVAMAVFPARAAAEARMPKDQPAINTTDADSVGATVEVAPDTANKIVQHPSMLVFDSLNWKVPLGDPYRTTLKNGIVAYIAADTSLPLVSVEAYIRSGSLNDPAGKEGQGLLMTRLLRTGGVRQYPADTLDALIDLFAMKFSFSQTESHIAFSASFLSEYADTAMHIMKQLFFNPTFDAKKLKKERSIMLESIKHRFVNPGPTLSVAARKHLYPQTAASKLTTKASLKRIRRNDLVALHKTAFLSSDIIISASGNFNGDNMLSKLNAVFDMPMQRQSMPLPEPTIAPQTRALVVHKEINQAYVRMLLPLFKRPHPDYYAVSLLNYILGGSGFISRLGTRVRSDEGLTYSIYSRAESNYTYPGTFFIEFFTKTESYPKAISIIQEELNNIIKDGVTENELDNAREALISELPSSFRSPEDIVSTYAWNEFYGRAPDHYAKYPEELRKITLNDIKIVANKYIAADKISYTIVGDTTALNAAAKSASNFFTVTSLPSIRVITADSIELLP